MRLCWHKWIKQHETPKLRVQASSIGAVAALLFLVTGYTAMVSPAWFAMASAGAVLSGIVLIYLLATSEWDAGGNPIDSSRVLWAISDRVCVKCGKSKLDYTNQQLAEKRAQERLKLYTETLRDVNND